MIFFACYVRVRLALCAARPIRPPYGVGQQGGLQVVENRNGANDKIFYGREGAITAADREHAEVSMLALHLLQSSLVSTQQDR
ncbi:Tn3 family transposase [Streptosporangium sp. G11]|uniref:Tn3 family transposase n=1 Tax=Streptosporangium sp. G11 TaxID=3436926 RepID=UPI003EBF7D30